MSNSIYHRHHITPKCLLKHKTKEFIDHPSNLVRLRYDHHIAAHKWLFMLTGDAGCEHAYNRMKNGTWLFDSTGIKLSESHKLKIGNSIRGMFSGINHPMYGKHHSYKTKQIWSINRKGKNTGIDHHSSKKWFINGKLFYSSYDASKHFGVNSCTIRRWCEKNIPHCYCI